MVATTALLTFLPLVTLLVLFEAGESGLYFGTFTYMFSGNLFASDWDRIHAGFALDQPTIGKWYFWFSVFTVLSIPYLVAIKCYCVRQSIQRHTIFCWG